MTDVADIETDSSERVNCRIDEMSAVTEQITDEDVSEKVSEKEGATAGAVTPAAEGGSSLTFRDGAGGSGKSDRWVEETERW